MVVDAKEKYLSSLGKSLSDPQTCKKKYWSVIKKLLKKNISSVTPPILHCGNFIVNAVDKCNIFNEYFKINVKPSLHPASSPL